MQRPTIPVHVEEEVLIYSFTRISIKTEDFTYLLNVDVAVTLSWNPQ